MTAPAIPSPEASRARTDWRSVAALNAVSALAQVGQFGVAFMVLPIWLLQHGLEARQLGLFASSLWLGQLPGLAFAPRWSARFGARGVVIAGLLCSALALLLLGWKPLPLYLLAGVLAGFGLGLRWIGLEPWLYHLAPSDARGRLVGFHETLISLAPVVGPALSTLLGMEGWAPLLVGLFFTLAALVPLAWARSAPDSHSEAPAGSATGAPRWRERVFWLGLALAVFGGMTESAFTGLFPLWGLARQLDSAQMAGLLTLFGLGGLLLQYPAGWLADHRGMGYACASCALLLLVAALLLSLPLPLLALQLTMLWVGGLVTCYLTLALVAGTATRAGTLARNVSTISMVYTASGVAGPQLVGAAVTTFGGAALVWAVAVLAALLGGVTWLIGRAGPRLH